MNMLVKRVPGREYLITDMIATKLSGSTVERIKSLNSWLSDYHFLKSDDIDFSWWDKCHKKLTQSRIYSGVDFDIDFRGNVTEIK